MCAWEWVFICTEECVRYFFLWGLGTMQGNAFKTRKQHGLVLDLVGRQGTKLLQVQKSCCCNRFFFSLVLLIFYLFLYCDGKNALFVKDAQLCGCHYFSLHVFPSLNSVFIVSWVHNKEELTLCLGNLAGSQLAVSFVVGRWHKSFSCQSLVNHGGFDYSANRLASHVPEETWEKCILLHYIVIVMWKLHIVLYVSKR